MQITVLTGNEIADFRADDDIREFRKAAREYAEQNIVGTYSEHIRLEV